MSLLSSDMTAHISINQISISVFTHAKNFSQETLWNIFVEKSEKEVICAMDEQTLSQN